MKSMIRFLGALATIGLAGCTSSEALQPPATMPAAASLTPDQERPGAWNYRATNVDFQRYTRFIVEPAQVYRGAEASYEGVDGGELAEIARALTTETRRALSNGYTVTSKPGPGTARITLKLAGVQGTVSGLATASRILPVGAVANAVKGASGGSGSFTGGITVAAEIYDAQSAKLLGAAVRRYSPPVFDIAATLSTMDTARAAAREAAQDVRASVDRAHGKPAR
ncbi:DUF3313 domain-containing protein [Azospirillum doebereinerae]